MKCKNKKLFNPEAKEEYKLFCGQTTNILDLSKVKYPFFIELVDNVMYANNWLPQRVSNMEQDYIQYWNSLTEDEKEAYDNIFSFLIFLDSIQTNNLPNIADYVTLPEIVYFLARQTWEEALHSRSYGYTLINAVRKKEKINEITYKFRDNKTLLNRNKLVAGIYDECKENRSETNFLRVLIANYLLEGLYFYNGFQFFHNLASRGLMIATDTQIRYIQRDEQVHCKGFCEIIKIYKKEKTISDKEFEDIIYGMFEKAVEEELKFSNSIIGNKVLGITEDSIKQYTHYLANKRLKDIGLKQIFNKTENPYRHLEKIASIEDETSNRSNQFEVTSITYKSPEILDGWEDI